MIEFGPESEEWQFIKDKSVERIINLKIPAGSEDKFRHFIEMKQLLEGLSKASGLNPLKNESVEVFIKRALRKTIS
mgnify:FL=1